MAPPSDPQRLWSRISVSQGRPRGISGDYYSKWSCTPLVRLIQYIKGAYDSKFRGRATLAPYIGTPMFQYIEGAPVTYDSMHKVRIYHPWFNISRAPLALMISAIKDVRGSDWMMPPTPIFDSERRERPCGSYRWYVIYYVTIITLLFVVVFCRAQTIFSIFNQVSSSVCKEQSPGAYDSVYQKRTWRIRFNLSWAPLVPMDLSIKGAQAYMIQFNMILSMDPVAIPGSNTWPQDLRAPLGRLLMIYYYLFRVLLRADVRVLSTFIPPF